MQGTVMRPSVPLQADGTNDTGSMSKHMAPRTGSEANLGDDMEGGAADDLSNHNVHSRHILRTSSMSPSSDSPLRRTPTVQQNVVMYSASVDLFEDLLIHPSLSYHSCNLGLWHESMKL